MSGPLNGSANGTASTAPAALGKDDPAWLRHRYGAPDDATDDEVSAGHRALLASYEADAKAETVRLRADGLTRGWSLSPPGLVESGQPTADSEEADSALIIKPVASWLRDAAGLPEARALFGSLWFEGEMSILFASTNVGKSILAVQIAQSLASGDPVPGFEMEAEAGPVLYVDCELSPKQFETRYSAGGVSHRFSDQFARAEINPDALVREAWDEDVRAAVEQAVERDGYRRVIVDNITFLGRQSEKARDALPLMHALHRLKRKHGLSMLVLAHTPKRDESRPITLNDLAGSRHLANFADGVFALGRSSKETDARYVKQLKVRSAEMERHAENVAVCRVEKRGPMLGLWFERDGDERDHLQERSQADHSALDAQIVALAAEDASLSHREIARRLETNHKKVARALARAERDGGTGGTPGTRVPPVPGVPVMTPKGTGVVLSAEGGRVSVEVEGLPVSFDAADVQTADGAPF